MALSNPDIFSPRRKHLGFLGLILKNPRKSQKIPKNPRKSQKIPNSLQKSQNPKNPRKIPKNPRKSQKIPENPKKFLFENVKEKYFTHNFFVSNHIKQ